MIHSFSAKLAQEFGVLEALVYGHVVYVVNHSTSDRFVKSLRDFAAVMPYASRNSIQMALARLSKGTDTHEPVLVKLQVRGCNRVSFKVLDKSYAKTQQHRFNVAVAAEYGIIAAVVYHNVGYWIRANWQQKVFECFDQVDGAKYDYNADAMAQDIVERTVAYAAHYTSPALWASEHTYVSKTTVYRAFEDLVDAGLLVKEYTTNLPSWRLSDTEIVYIKRKYFNSGHVTELTCKIGREILNRDKVVHGRTIDSVLGTADSQTGSSYIAQVPKNQKVAPSKKSLKKQLLKANVLKARVGENTHATSLRSLRAEALDVFDVDPATVQEIHEKILSWMRELPSKKKAAHDLEETYYGKQSFSPKSETPAGSLDSLQDKVLYHGAPLTHPQPKKKAQQPHLRSVVDDIDNSPYIGSRPVDRILRKKAP